MKSAISTGMTHPYHSAISDQLYVSYAMGKDVMAMNAMVGEKAPSMEDHMYLAFLEHFEGNLVV